MLMKLWQDEVGAIISAELVLVMTIVVLGVSVGMAQLAGAVANELADVASAVGGITQSYGYAGLRTSGDLSELKGFRAGSGFLDRRDECDCSDITTVIPIIKIDGGNGGLEGGLAN